MNTVVLADIEVRYYEAGSTDAAPVVLVHGLAEDAQTWTPQMGTHTEYHLYAYDLRGHGGTSVGEADATLAQLDADLCRFLESVAGPAICVGFSLGGTIVLSAAASRPDLVKGAVVLGTSTVVGRSAVGFYEERIARALAAAPGQMAEALRADTAAALHTDVDLDAITETRLRAIGNGLGYVNAARAMAALNASPLTPRLADITSPVTVVGAEYDSFCPRKAADIILAGLPGAEYLEIPAAGHLMNVDNPAAVTSTLAAALKGMN